MPVVVAVSYLQAMIVAGRPPGGAAAAPRQVWRLAPGIAMLGAVLLAVIALRSVPIHLELLTEEEATAVALAPGLALGLAITGPWAVGRILPSLSRPVGGFARRSAWLFASGLALLVPSAAAQGSAPLLAPAAGVPVWAVEGVARYVGLLAFLVAAVILLQGQRPAPSPEDVFA